MTNTLTHLHVHTEHSALDGMGRIEELLIRARELGQTALAVTDHGTMGGLFELQKLAKKYGVKPILGCEFYLSIPDEDKLNHIVVLAMTNEGYNNMCLLSEYASVHGFYKKPTVTIEQLSKHNKGLICMSACLANIIPRSLSEGDYATARDYIAQFKTIFGDRFYLEVQSNVLPAQAIANKNLVQMAELYGVQYVATNDVHYTLKEDADVHEVLLAMQTKKKWDDPKRWSFPSKCYWLKNYDEMYTDLHGLTSEQKAKALATTNIIAERCNAEITCGEYKPRYKNMSDNEAYKELRKQTIAGLKAKNITDTNYVADTFNELEIIEDCGYTGYTLVVADMIKEAREAGLLVGDGRGSGAGSKVNYLVDITRVEPQEHNLLFERYLTKGRVPDIDTDFSDNIAVMKILQRKYGESNVARIVARGTLAPKAVIRKVFSTFNHSQALIAQITGCVPDDVKIDTLEKAYKANPKLVEWKKRYPDLFHIIERLEGRVCNLSKHAGGVVIYDGLTTVCPTHTESDDRTMRICSLDKYEVEELGLVKIDALGLVALGTTSDALRMIKEVEGVDVDIYDIDMQDEAVYADMCEGDVLEVFQLANQAGLTKRQQPKHFNDIVALSSVLRPGTCDTNEYMMRREVGFTLSHPERTHLEQSEGLIIYQEQYLQDCKVFAGWDYAFSDNNVRKNKKIKDDTDLREKFIADSIKNGFLREYVENVWEEIVTIVSGGYGFNKAHSVSYSYITYRTAWLKHYYPTYFLASALNKALSMSGEAKETKINNILAYAGKKDIALLPPNLNTSSDKFYADANGIHMPLTMVKGLGESVVPYIETLRPIKGFYDLLERSEKKYLRINVMENLIKAGTFDSEGTRPELLNVLYKERKAKKECLLEDNNDSRMQFEKEALGVYLTRHPMQRYAFKDVTDFPEGKQCLIAGIITSCAIRHDKTGCNMAFITINNQYGNTKVLAFSKTWRSCIESDFEVGNTIMIRGKRSAGDCLLDSYEVLDK